MNLQENQAQGNAGNIWEYLAILQKRWLLILFVFAAFAAGGVFHASRQPKVYKATASISITPPQSRRIGNIQIEQGVNAYPWDKSYLNTQMEILKSRTMGNKFVKKIPETLSRSIFGVPRDKLRPGWILGRLQVKHKKNTDIVYIICTGKKPEGCKNLANLIAKVYIEDNKQKNESAQGAILEWLKKETPLIRNKMLKVKEAIIDFENKNGKVLLVSNPKSENDLDRLKRELQDIKIEMSKAEIRYKKCLKAKKMKLAQAVLQINFYDDNSLIEDLRKQEIEINNQLMKYKMRYKDNHPKIELLTRNLNNVKKKIEEEVYLIISHQEEKYRDLQAQKKYLENLFQDLHAEKLASKGKILQYDHYKREHEALKKTYDSFLDKMKEMDSVVSYRVDNIQMVDEAVTPSAPYTPGKSRTYLLSAILGLMAGIGLAFLLELLDETVKTPEEIQEILSGDLLGFVPYISSKILPGKAQLTVQNHRKSALAEVFRSITTSIFFHNDKKDQGCFTITSPMAQDGKTTTVCNLALTLAQTGHKVLLIDGDLRRPQLRKVFDLEQGKGFSELLQGTASLNEVAREVAENFWCITAGKIPKDAYETLRKSPLQQILEQAQKTYQYVLIDAPPIGITNDALLMAKVNQGLLFLISLQRSNKKLLHQLSGRLKSLDIPVKGVIVNDIKGSTSAQVNYYNYYGHYYSKSYYHTYSLEGETEEAAS